MHSNSSPPATVTPNNAEIIDNLPKAHFWGIMELRRWEGFWLERRALEQAMTFRSGFEARDDDVLLTSAMKTGTGWLKSISFSIMKDDASNEDALTTESPYSIVPTIVTSISSTDEPPRFDLHDASASRLLHTHVPYSLLPDSVKNSACRIIYITRNPKDTVISTWHFINAITAPFQEPFPLEEAVDCFCSGVHLFGPFFDHVLEYWLESRRRPEKILFLRYEELKSDPGGQVSKIAEFMGRPFRDRARVDEIVRRCSFQRLKNLEVNKGGSYKPHVPRSVFLRKGEVGDWSNYLTPEMAERIDQTSRIKLEPFGLSL